MINVFTVSQGSRDGLYSWYREFLNSSTDFIEAIVWIGFGLSVLVAFFPQAANEYLNLEPVVVVDGLARVIWPYVTFLTGLLLNFSKRYMAGNHRLGFFFLRCLFFLLSVMVLASTNQMFVFLLAWLSMGWFMAGLIGHKIEWNQARAAGRLALQYFLAGTLYLSVGMLVLYQETATVLISSSLEQVDQLTAGQLYVIFGCLLVAAIIQSALFPVQDWLMSSMTAPTPASALMHAGFVNAGGILLTRFSPIFARETTLMLIVVAVGALSALMGKIWKMVQTAIKRQLGCSTIAQMGFMLLECGLGFFSAAISHLILHGFYKGYLFLDSGNAIEEVSPDPDQDESSGLIRNAISLVVGLLGGATFVLMTGKGSQFNSGLFLAFIVVLTIMHGTRDVLSRTSMPGSVRHVVFPLLALTGTVLYSAIFNLVTVTMSDLPLVAEATPFTWVHGLIAAVFLGLWVAMETDLLKQSSRLYVYILNASQPHPATVLSSKEEYHV